MTEEVSDEICELSNRVRVLEERVGEIENVFNSADQVIKAMSCNETIVCGIPSPVSETVLS